MPPHARVHGSTGSRLSVDALVAVADEALAGLDHRRVDIEPAGVAESMRGRTSRREAG
jgi:hypothetical protein